jgi:hypothetical protein
VPEIYRLGGAEVAGDTMAGEYLDHFGLLFGAFGNRV